jgi:hypothetical protein
MSVEYLNEKLLSRQLNKTPTPYQIQRQIEENVSKQMILGKIEEAFGIKNPHPSLVEIVNKDQSFIANFEAGLENIKKRPDGDVLMSLIEFDDIRADGTIRVSKIKKKI